MRPLPTDHMQCAPPPQGGCQHGDLSCPVRLQWIEDTRTQTEPMAATHTAMPIGVAKALADYHRGIASTTSEEYLTSWHRQMADILDPPNRLTLREALLVFVRDEDLGYDDMADEILNLVRKNLLEGWPDYADKHAFSADREPGYVINTHRVPDYITERLSQ